MLFDPMIMCIGIVMALIQKCPKFDHQHIYFRFNLADCLKCVFFYKNFIFFELTSGEELKEKPKQILIPFSEMGLKTLKKFQAYKNILCSLNCLRLILLIPTA